MGRHADKQRTRITQALARALTRGDAEPALAALLELAPEERSAHLAPVGALVRTAVAADFRARRWDRLAFWAARVEREGRLLDAAGGELRWALFWGRARTTAWSKAAALLGGLSTRLPAGLFQALQAYVAAAGAPPPAALVGWCPSAPTAPASTDRRLGYDRGQAPRVTTAEPEAPVHPDEVEEKVLAAAAILGWNRFAAVTDGWATRTPALAHPVRVLAAQLSIRPLLERAQGGDGHWAEPARLIASACQDLGHPETLQEPMALALRVAVRAADGTVGPALEACRMAGAALGYPELAALALAAFCDLAGLDPGDEDVRTKDEERLARATLALGERLLERRCDPDLFWRALLVWEGASHELEAPAWLRRAFSALLEAKADLAGALARIPSADQGRCVDVFADALPLPLVEPGLEAMWGPGGDALRPHLAHAAGGLIERLRPVSLSAERLAEGAQLLREQTGIPVSPEEVRAIMQGMEGCLPDFLGEPAGPLAGKALALWKRFGERLLPYDVRYLEHALKLAPDRAAREAALDRYLANRSDAEAMVDELCSADATMSGLAAAAIERRLLERYACDPDALAGALLKALRMGAPRPLLESIGEVLVYAADHLPAHGPKVQAALPVAHLLVRTPKKRRKAKVKTQKSKPARPPRAGKSQLDLFGGGGRGHGGDPA